MSKLLFKSEEIKGIMEHVVNTENSKLMIVKDQGVYIMSPSYRLGENSVIAYAQGFNPSINEDWFDVAHAQLGGDDSVDYLDADFAKIVLEQIEAENEEITIIMSKNSIKLGKPKKIKPILSLVSNEETKTEGTLIQTPPPIGFETVEIPNGVQVTPVFEETKPEIQEPKVEEPKVKAGLVIRDRFQSLINEGKINEEVLKIITDTELTKTNLGIRYAFLLEYDGTKSVKEQGSINGHIRYSSKVFEVSGKQYLITNDIYSRNVEKFMNWSNSL